MSQTGKLLPNIDRQSTKLLNLTVLQRIDPCIEEILLTAAHVTFYEFNIDSNQWSRKDVEGSLFVVKRNTQPGFQFIVMNRRNTENLVENLLGDFEYEVQMPYLLYRNSAQEVNGIWFYNSRECEDVANIFNRILDTYSKVPLNPEIASSKSEFEEQVSSVTASKQQVKSSSTALGVNNAANDSSFTNFFQAADMQNSAPTPNNPGLPYHSSGIDSPVSASSLLPSPLAPHQVPSIASSAPSVILAGMHDASDSISKSNQIKNLLKPSTFYTAPYASSLMTPHVSSSNPSVTSQPSITAHRPYGNPLLQPFPPPAPSSSLTPDTSTTNSVSFVDRDKVRDALIMLVQDNQFIDMICQALQKVHHT